MYPIMRPEKSLPYSDEFASADEYVDTLLHYITTTPIFQTLCGGVHIMDFYSTDPGLFYSVVPADWQSFLLAQEPMALLDFLLRDDLDKLDAESSSPPPPSLLQYVRDVRRLSLQRGLAPAPASVPVPSRRITMGMSVKKIHEVKHFAHFVNGLADTVSAAHPTQPVTHLVDVGSGQNYLGRALASPPYRRRVVAVESKASNIDGAKGLDMLTGIAAPVAKPMRNKKLYQQLLKAKLPPSKQNEKVRKRLARAGTEALPVPEADLSEERKEGCPSGPGATVTVELRSHREIARAAVSKALPSEDAAESDNDSPILYVQGRLENGDLSAVIAQVPPLPVAKPGNTDGTARDSPEMSPSSPGFLAVSIHSCGNLSHYGLRALVLNPAVRAVAIVGCCYNMMTEKLGPPTFKLPGMRRPTLQPVNGRLMREAERRDPEGFPMSTRLSTYALGHGPETHATSACPGACDHGIRFNITARMMACQAPQNWTAAESENFFTRHFYRAILQRIFLDRGVLGRVQLDGADGAEGIKAGDNTADPLNTAVSPIIIGSLRKACYASLSAYVRGAVAKIATQGNSDGSATPAQNAAVNAAVAEKMATLTDAELEAYAVQYGPRIRELSAVWSLMAFSAGVVESAIVTDRWLWLREQQVGGAVADCWVESVFAYDQSPRNLVVVGIKQ